jgi:NitT/TauT family transport system substrate-binding protein
MGMIKLIDSLEQEKNCSMEVRIMNEPIQVRKMVIDGSADFAILPTTMAALLYNKGFDYQIIAIPVWGTLYLLGSDTEVTDWEDLRDRRVHVMAKGMTPDVLFRFLLKKNGLDPEKDITLDYRFPTHIELANAVAAGQTEFAVISEPLVSLTMQNNKAIFPIIDLNHEWKKLHDVPLAQTALIAKRSIIESNPQLVEELLLKYEESTKWVNENPNLASSLIVKYNILPNSTVALSAIPRSNLNFVRAKCINIQIEDYLKVFYDMNPDIVGGKIPDENFYY